MPSSTNPQPPSAPHTDVTVTPTGALPVSPDALARGYEPERMGIRGYVIFVLVVIVSAIVIHLGLWWIMRGFEAATSHRDVRTSALQSETPLPPPGPLLQPSVVQGSPRQAWQDMADYRVREEKSLNSYGYDPRSGEARIPIERAMELLVQRGLPTTQPSMRLSPPATRQLNPESSGGR